jgi:phage shock protein C
VEKERDKQLKAKHIYKSRKDRIIDGVCGGVAEYTGLDVTLVRILWVASIFINGLGIITYILFMIFVPLNPDHLSLNTNEIKKQNPALFIGVFFVLFGLILVMRNFDFSFFWPFKRIWRLTHWWGISWEYVWPFILIALGVGYILFMINRNREPSKSSKQDPKLYRTADNKIIGGVCGGLGKHLGLDPTLVRIAFLVLSVLLHVFPGIILYIVLYIVLPLKSDNTAS